jgi:hypothetical protein
LNKEVFAFSILTDVNKKASGKAFECKKVKIYRDYRDNYLFQRFRSDSVEIIKSNYLERNALISRKVRFVIIN